MKWSWVGLALFYMSASSWGSVPAPKPRLDPHMSTGYLMNEVVQLVGLNAIAAVGAQRPAAFASIGLNRDEYIYSIRDRHFIRTIQKRFELPSWRLCGDWAQVRVEVFDENMESVGPPEVWAFAYRDEQWLRLALDEGGFFRKSNLEEVQLPPYAIRCFNLDHKEITDTVQ